MMSTTLRVCLLCVALLAGCTGGSSGDSAGSSGNPGNGNGKHSTITLSPTNLAFSVSQGDTNPTHTVGISNSGNGTLDWSLSTPASWLTFSPSSGTSVGNAPTTFTSQANLAGLPAGTYSTTITVASSDATNSPQTISVTLTIASSTSATSSPSTTTSGSSSTSSTSPSSSSTSGTTTVAVGIAWDQAALSSGGYYVYYGTTSPSLAGSCAYAQSTFYSLASLANPSSPAAVISGLTVGRTYYFAVSAYNGSLEGACSNEIWKAM